MGPKEYFQSNYVLEKEYVLPAAPSTCANALLRLLLALHGACHIVLPRVKAELAMAKLEHEECNLELSIWSRHRR